MIESLEGTGFVASVIVPNTNVAVHDCKNCSSDCGSKDGLETWGVNWGVLWLKQQWAEKVA